MYNGLPQFDEDGFYTGPLPRKTGVNIGQQHGQSKTAAAAEWPPLLCQWVAEKIVSLFLQNSTWGAGARSGEKRKMNFEEEATPYL